MVSGTVNSDVQSGVVAPIYSVGDGGDAGGVADDAHVGHGVHQGFYCVGGGALAQGADYGAAGD